MLWSCVESVLLRTFHNIIRHYIRHEYLDYYHWLPVMTDKSCLDQDTKPAWAYTHNHNTITAAYSLDDAEELLEEITDNVRGVQSQAQVERLDARQALWRRHTVNIFVSNKFPFNVFPLYDGEKEFRGYPLLLWREKRVWGTCTFSNFHHTEGWKRV